MEQKRENDSSCSFHQCEELKYRDFDKCILHCSKSNLSYHPDIVEEFYTILNSFIGRRKKTRTVNLIEIQYPIGCNNTFNEDIDTNSNAFNFVKCSFMSDLLINHPVVKFNKCKFYSITLERISFKKQPIFYFERCVFQNDFKLHNSHLDSLIFNNCQFDSKVSIISNVIDYLSFSYTSFNSPVTVGANTIGSTLIPNITFCHFDTISDFQGNNFPSGLNISNCHMPNTVNFLDSELYSNKSLSKTPRETFRLIKHSFDNIGNTIEANKYFALEMKAYERELKENGGTKSEKFLLWINRVTSDYGQNWLRSFSLLFSFNFILTVIYLFLQHSGKKIIVTQTDVSVYHAFNTFAKFITPLKDLHFKGHEFLTLIIGIVNGILIYQTIVALKRKTRR